MSPRKRVPVTQPAPSWERTLGWQLRGRERSVASRPLEGREKLPALAWDADRAPQVQATPALTGGWAAMAMSLLGLFGNFLLER